MQVHVLFFAQARERAGRARVTLELPAGSRVSHALTELERLHPGLAELRPHLAVAVDQKLAAGDAVIRDGAEMALLPPVSGGAPAGDRFTIAPVTAEKWRDLERLFGERGACAGCWCQWPRLQGAEFKAGAGEPNKRRLRRLVESGPPPGLIGYWGAEPVAWLALAPRADYVRLERSRILTPVDDQPVWSVPCFFVARPFRKRGLTVRMLREAARYARTRGARILEGYPVDPPARVADAFVWWGLARTFEQAGFREVARRSTTRPIMRKTLGPARVGSPGEAVARPARTARPPARKRRRG
jgi:molybdopterin converting factor subunit 1